MNVIADYFKEVRHVTLFIDDSKVSVLPTKAILDRHVDSSVFERLVAIFTLQRCKTLFFLRKS